MKVGCGWKADVRSVWRGFDEVFTLGTCAWTSDIGGYPVPLQHRDDPPARVQLSIFQANPG
jgi:hypothetical protein